MKKVVLLFVALVMAVSCAVAFAADEKPEVAYGVAVGSLSQPVELKSVDQKTVLNTGKLAKPTVFLLVSSVCTACAFEMQEVGGNVDQFKDKDVFIVIIDIDPGRAAQSLSKWNLPMLTDSDWKLGQATGLASAPSVVILGTDGKIMYKKYGYMKDQWKEYLKQ
jgi:hypothetical protein